MNTFYNKYFNLGTELIAKEYVTVMHKKVNEYYITELDFTIMCKMLKIVIKSIHTFGG